MKKQPLIIGLFLLASALTPLLAQDQDANAGKPKAAASSAPTPKNMFEVGINGGLSIIAGDVKPLPSYGIGFHARKALDYVFSLRGDFLFAKPRGADPTTASQVLNREFETTWYSGTIFGVISLNSLRWNRPVRTTNLYLMAGGGGNSFNSEFQNEFTRKGTLKSSFTPHIALGAGVAVRVSNRINIGLEHQAMSLFGANTDLLDGSNFESATQKSLFRDILNFSNLSVNFNIGNPSSKSEPLYWINPLETVLNDVRELKNRPVVSLEDSDQDGVIDALDLEPNSPPGAIVDTRGRTLDSDRDGVPDYLDKEPFYTPREGEIVNAEGVVINSMGGGRGGVTEDRVRELISEALQQSGTINDLRNTAAEWFLPMLHFNNDSYTVKYSDYGNLSSIARTLRSNPSMRLVVTGYADATGSESYNNQLSYNRAKAVIEHLVNTHSIGRGRLVLQWKGSAESLVPSNSSFMNRRVEFRMATPGDVEMDPPGTKTDGY